MADQKVLGMITPSQGGPPGGDIMDLIPPEVRSESVGLGLREMTMEEYGKVLGKVEGAAAELKNRGAQAIVVVGTSLTFSAGYDYHTQLLEKIRSVSGLPTTTMSAAVADALNALKIRRFVAATAYTEEVNAALRSFFEKSGFQVEAVRGLGLKSGTDAYSVKPETVSRMAEELFREHPGAEGILVSCGAFRVMSMIDPLEKSSGVPVVVSNQATGWAALRLLGLDAHRAGYGKLLS